MATIPNPASPKFPDVYQIETSDPVQGGPNGISNKSTKDLVERTQYLNLNKANTATKIVAGNGLTGGGTLGSDTTVTLGTPSALTDKSTNAVTDTGHTHSLQKSSTAVAGIVQLNDTLTSDSTALALTAKQGKALKGQVDKAISFFTADESLPTDNIGPIWHEKYASLMTWETYSANGANYTGYASVDIGRIPHETQPVLRLGYIRSGASSYSQITYAALFNWAKHHGLVKTVALWSQGTIFYRDNADGTFTPPDVRGEFPRYWDDGRGVDKGRSFGTVQADGIKDHIHPLTAFVNGSAAVLPGVEAPSTAYTVSYTTRAEGAKFFDGVSTYGGTGMFTKSGHPSFGVETRPSNVAALAAIKF